ncbi:hypothetical protein [uncultured Demequina sp.]|uniref:hypothetical protein n=1 Tax=uncultured Demequina sp. TaxID=693499 RepID=UPI0025DAED45|nr:hypothetical protein [uncultured Demequina sp.]
MKTALAYLVLAAGGVITASVGAVAHRGFAPWGVIGSVLMVAFAAVFARTSMGFSGLGAFAATWVAMTLVWSLEGPGGSVLIAQDALGISWLVGSAVVMIAAAIVPTRILVGRHGAA